ncbi:hypothetical protein [Dinghuibacter silviterrae]|uniref:Spy/CpxP family protein refolding chaperone n=1 Tax=Dinghuibacter silviterrae TaxID=1539049 RepID=A0A4R8DI28_9BACT|nr:hypothetical protein [Dinghuibacter silviterrae]TDW97401.1 hypothetical protein EDB95_5249 [Dinghuibacter silviterrae]
MIKTGIFSLLFIAGGLLAKAQDTGVQTSDTTHPHNMHRAWSQGPNGAQGPGQRWGGEGFAHRGMHPGGEGFAHMGMPPVHYTPEQRKQVMAINTEYRRKQDDLYKQDNLTLGAYKSQLVALQKEKKAKLKALITPEQQQQIDRWKSRASENAQVMAAARLERMKIRLQLTDDQEAKIKTQDEAFRTQIRGIRENDDLLPEQKREQMQELFSKQKDAMAAILTPDQQAKLKTFGAGHGRFDGGHRMDAPANN